MELGQVRERFAEGRLQDRLRLRPGQVDLGELLGLIGQLDRFGDQVLVEVLQDLLVEPRRHVEPEGVPAAGQHVVDERVGQHLGPVVAEVRLAPAAERQAVDVVGAQVVQERRGVLARDFNLARWRAVEQGCTGQGRIDTRVRESPKCAGTSDPATSVKVAPRLAGRSVRGVGRAMFRSRSPSSCGRPG